MWILQVKRGAKPPPFFEVNGLKVVQKDQNPNLLRISVLIVQRVCLDVDDCDLSYVDE